jgi:hypothetical protein
MSCNTVSDTAVPAAANSAAFASSRCRSDQTAGSYSGFTGPCGSSSGRPVSISTSCRCHHSARATALAGNPSSAPAGGTTVRTEARVTT